jgi:streptogramin lyase
MTDDQREVCYAQLGNGVIGCFDIETETYVDKLALPDIHSGPRRITMGDDGVLWVALFGSGQIAAYDTNTHKLIDIYDLPDRGSAPYAVTWDPVRKMVWVPTSNTDVIYRFNPADNSFGVLPLPRQRTLLRMVDVDPETGALITSYANIIEQVQGPRMALVIEPGDDAYPKKLNFKGEK